MKRPVEGNQREPATSRPVVAGAETRALGSFSALYERILRSALARRPLTLLVASCLLVGALLVAGRIGTELIPAISEGEFFYEITLPEGASLHATDRSMGELERIVNAESGIAHSYSTVGSRLVAGGMSLNTKSENVGQINVVIEDRADEAFEQTLAERLRLSFAVVPEVTAKHGKPTYFSLKTPIEVVLFSDDLEFLRDATGSLTDRLGNVPGLADVRSSLEDGSPELQVIFDRERLAALGLDVRALSETLQSRVQGDVVTEFKEADRQIDVRVRNREDHRATADDIRNLIVPGPNGDPIRLLTLAEVIEARGPAEIHRLQQQRAAVISCNLNGVSLGRAVERVRETIGAYALPPGVAVEIGGQNREMEVSFASLRFAIALAIFLVYLVMASTFESLVHPFVVLFTIPLALVGVVAGLLLTGTVISVIVLIGTIMLVGIVVNNAIVLIDTVNQLRRKGAEKLDALIQACHIRLRPILMTTLTTVLGLLPMAIGLGEGAELRAPLAIVVSSGLMFSTLLTLLVIPVVYSLVPSRVRVESPIQVTSGSER